MKKRTNMNVETSLVAQAASILGTRGTTETVHAAMEDVVRRARLKRLATRDLSELTPQTVAEMRKPRTAGRVRGGQPATR